MISKRRQPQLARPLHQRRPSDSSPSPSSVVLSSATIMDGTGGDIRRRRRLAPHETEFLARIFEQYPRPTGPMREMIAKRLGMSARGVQIWFQNKRAKVRRDMLESGRAMLLFSPTIPSSAASFVYHHHRPAVSAEPDHQVPPPASQRQQRQQQQQHEQHSPHGHASLGPAAVVIPHAPSPWSLSPPSASISDDSNSLSHPLLLTALPSDWNTSGGDYSPLILHPTTTISGGDNASPSIPFVADGVHSLLDHLFPRPLLPRSSRVSGDESHHMPHPSLPLTIHFEDFLI